MKKKKNLKTTAIITLSAFLLTACGGSDYDSYSAAYKKVSANGGMDADFDVTLNMDGTTSKGTGNFKLDTSGGNNILYSEMDIDGSTVTQFSDGKYIYTESGGNKTKYSMSGKPSTADSEKSAQKESSQTFNKSAFLSEFSSFLEAGKIKELGLLSPVESAAVKDISEKDGVYTITFSDSLVKKYLNTMIANETQSSGSDKLTIDELTDFKCKATVKKDVVTNVEYSGTIAVKVPASLMESGTEADYDLDFTIKIKFVNPGDAVSISIPSTDGYTEL